MTTAGSASIGTLLAAFFGRVLESDGGQHAWGCQMLRLNDVSVACQRCAHNGRTVKVSLLSVEPTRVTMRPVGQRRPGGAGRADRSRRDCDQPVQNWVRASARSTSWLRDQPAIWARPMGRGARAGRSAAAPPSATVTISVSARPHSTSRSSIETLEQVGGPDLLPPGRRPCGSRCRAGRPPPPPRTGTDPPHSGASAERRVERSTVQLGNAQLQIPTVVDTVHGHDPLR